MKILLVGMSFDPTAVAKSYRVNMFARYLIERGYELITISGTEYDDKIMKRSDVPVYNYTMPRILERFGVWGIRLEKTMLAPDRGLLWAVQVYNKAVKICRRHRVDLVIVSSPPHCMQVLGVWLKKKLKIPYIADLRDDWKTSTAITHITPVHKNIDHALEELVISECSALILNNERTYTRFATRYKKYLHKFNVITNGYDEAGWNEVASVERDEPAIIMYAGGGYGNKISKLFKLLCEEIQDKNLSDKWQIVTAGPNICTTRTNCATWKHHGIVIPEALPFWYMKSTVLVAFDFSNKSETVQLPLKLYSYLRSSRFVLYVGPEGAPTDLLSDYEGVGCISLGQWPNIFEWLESNEDVLKRPYYRNVYEKYSFEQLTRKLIDVIENV